MKEELLKLAAVLRKKDEENKKKKAIKCAQVAQAALGLELLREKIGG